MPNLLFIVIITFGDDQYDRIAQTKKQEYIYLLAKIADICHLLVDYLIEDSFYGFSGPVVILVVIWWHHGVEVVIYIYKEIAHS